MKCDNQIYYRERTNKAGKKSKKEVYSFNWFQQRNGMKPPENIKDLNDPEICDGNMVAKVHILYGPHRDDEEVELVLECDKCEAKNSHPEFSDGWGGKEEVNKLLSISLPLISKRKVKEIQGDFFKENEKREEELKKVIEQELKKRSRGKK